MNRKGITDQLSTLGSGVTTLLDLTNSYGIIANGGLSIKPNIIKTIYSQEGKKIFESTQKKCLNCNVIDLSDNTPPTIKKNLKRIIDPKIAFQITSMMEGVILRGTAKKLKYINTPIARAQQMIIKMWFLAIHPIW